MQHNMAAIKLFFLLMALPVFAVLSFTEADALLSALWSSLAIFTGVDAFRNIEIITSKQNNDGKTYPHQREL